MKKVFLFSILAFCSFIHLTAQTTVTTIVSDLSWSASVTPQLLDPTNVTPKNWAVNTPTNPPIAGGWRNAVLATAGSGPAVAGAQTIGTVVNQVDGTAAYFRKNFTVSGCIDNATIALNADDFTRVFVNGIQVFQGLPLSSVTCGSCTPAGVTFTQLSSNSWNALVNFNIAPFLVQGNNTIAVQLMDFASVGYFRLAARIETINLPAPTFSTTTSMPVLGGTYTFNAVQSVAFINPNVKSIWTLEEASNPNGPWTLINTATNSNFAGSLKNCKFYRISLVYQLNKCVSCKSSTIIYQCASPCVPTIISTNGGNNIGSFNELSQTIEHQYDEKAVQWLQSSPNPVALNSTTLISYQLPKETNTAFILFYDMLGRELKRVAITEELGQIPLSTQDLLPATYIYTLVADGKIVATQKLVVAKN